MNGLRPTIDIHGEMAFDSRDFFATIIAFISAVSVILTLWASRMMNEVGAERPMCTRP
ncbi:hypothetical protein FC98_GL002329 [Lentilactobacillus kisonensis DSM 19906 = JCM 15041]|uniref:Uncharacterized protein n=1 Tax=Lentilactobacillus kisonensis DSM 19906 = JCM 15041 TaxID=1423766 RepID=A0A0R1NDX6_9LACO|nr:hypothetical protein FC98_GL002329 [Lentilactobacillus kisonensis DSM 19906 = JCM 15041]